MLFLLADVFIILVESIDAVEEFHLTRLDGSHHHFVVNGYLVFRNEHLSNHFFAPIQRHSQDICVERDSAFLIQKQPLDVLEVFDGLEIFII